MSVSFNQLHPVVQKAVWDMGWRSFRPIQDKAIELITGTEQHLLIAAPTASGKTEAAFLPLISRYYPELLNGLGILYIAPLKALINDQFGRIEALCGKTEIPITPWHGDVDNGRKRKRLKVPRGIVLITPESIEALLLHKVQAARAFFGGVQCVVVDEVHAFLGGERGIHLYSLLNRIQLATGKTRLRKVALSATLGDLAQVEAWLACPGEEVAIIRENDSGKAVFGTIICVERSLENPGAFRNELALLTRNGKNLIFSNSKNSLENACDLMKKECALTKSPDSYGIHHGSLSPRQRENTESELKNRPVLSVFCTQTLELGIDIGDIEKVVLLAPPGTVAAFIQRIGRSGRKENRPITFAFLLESEPFEATSSYELRLQLELVQAIALVELYLEGYCEPYRFDLEDYSCLVHEILAYLVQLGGCSPGQLYQDIVQNSFKSALGVEDFILLLKHLKELGYIEQLSGGELVLSEKGEILTGNYMFYAVFHSSHKWKIVHEGELIGELPYLAGYKVGDQMLLGARRWEIVSINPEIKHIFVKESLLKKEVRFEPMREFISKKIQQKMKEVYEKAYIPPYLDQTAGKLLQAAFDQYRIIKQDPYCLLHFQGTRIGNGLKLLFTHQGIKFQDFAVGFELRWVEARRVIGGFQKEELTREAFLEAAAHLSEEEKRLNKYDFLLPGFLLDRSYIKTLMDVQEVREYIAQYPRKIAEF